MKNSIKAAIIIVASIISFNAMANPTNYFNSAINEGWITANKDAVHRVTDAIMKQQESNYIKAVKAHVGADGDVAAHVVVDVANTMYESNLIFDYRLVRGNVSQQNKVYMQITYDAVMTAGATAPFMVVLHIDYAKAKHIEVSAEGARYSYNNIKKTLFERNGFFSFTGLNPNKTN